MIENWLAQARKGISAPDRAPLRWMRVLPSSVWIILAVLAFAGGRMAWFKSAQTPRLKEITAAFGGVSLLENPPQFSHDGSRLTYVTVTEMRGVGLFLRDRLSNETRLMVTQTNGTGYWNDTLNLRAWPWSPDDKMVAFSVMDSVTICPTELGQTPTTYALETNASVSGLVWLNPSELVWAETNALGHAIKPPNGPWAFDRYPAPGRVNSLMALDAHTVGWTQDGYLCRIDFSEDKPEAKKALDSLRVDAFSAPVKENLILWLDASTLKLADGADVTELSDLSPKRNKAVSVQNPPKYNAPTNSAALNGNGTIHFDGNPARGLATTRNLGIAGNTPRTVFAVERRGWTFYMGFGNAGGSAGNYFGLCDQSDALYLPATVGTVTKYPNFPAAWNILTVGYDGATLSGLVNGVLKGSAPFKLDTAESPFEIGIRNAVASGKPRVDTSSGDLAEILVYDRVLSAQEREQVEKYLSAKWFGIRHISADSSLVWRDTQMDNIAAVQHNKTTGQCLIQTTNAGGSKLWVLTPTAGPGANITSMRPPIRRRVRRARLRSALPQPARRSSFFRWRRSGRPAGRFWTARKRRPFCNLARPTGIHRCATT